jgi:hypothetical protein
MYFSWKIGVGYYLHTVNNEMAFGTCLDDILCVLSPLGIDKEQIIYVIYWQSELKSSY